MEVKVQVKIFKEELYFIEVETSHWPTYVFSSLLSYFKVKYKEGLSKAILIGED